MIRRSAGLLGLLACAAAAWAQAPTPAQSGAAIEMSRKVALTYGRSLPDFICTQLVHRYIDLTHRTGLVSWRTLDTLTIQLSYFDRTENHKLVLINGKSSEKSYSDLGGAITVGEFALIQQQIFDPASQAVFTWKKWNEAGKRRAAIYLYRVDVSHSRYSLKFLASAGLTEAGVGYHGMVEVDRETGAVLGLTYIADAIPKTCPIYLSTTAVTYDFADVGGKQYLLPASSEMEMRSRELWARNHTQYRDYRKFSADSTVRFGDAK
jgi:hypothetical protein